MTTNTNPHIRKLWTQPWGYHEGFFIAFGIVITGFALEAISGSNGIEPIAWPLNFIILFAFIFILTGIYILWKRKPIIQWLSGVPAAVSSIALFAFLGLMLGFVPQDDVNIKGLVRTLGITHMTNNYAFVLAQLYFLTTLGLVTIKRAAKFSAKNIGFLLNHAGLWITIAAATLGSGDLKLMTMQIDEGKNSTNIATDHYNNTYELSIGIKLNNFDIELYNPKIAMAQIADSKILYGNKQNFATAKIGEKTELHGWKISVVDYIETARRNKQEYVPTDVYGAAPAAKIQAKNVNSGKEINGWISCGNFRYSKQFLELDEKHFLAMLEPEPKRYSSEIEYTDSQNKKGTFKLEVNKPVTIDGWKIYQTGFDERYGRWSTISVLELVSDPWLPLVYTGIFMMLAGAIYIFWIGKDIKGEPEKRMNGEKEN